MPADAFTVAELAESLREEARRLRAFTWGEAEYLARANQFDAAAARLESHRWRPIKTVPQEGRVLVTNNLRAKDADGLMSHLWVVQPIKASDPEKDGAYVAYDSCDRKVCF